ncbi:MAG: DNA polymerase III subunit delta [Pseudomonadota bacterium]
MKLGRTEAARFCRSPDPACCGALLHGPDAGLLTLRRQELVAALTEGDPMRLTRLEPDAIRRDPASLETALKARGFFADRSAILLEGAKDSVTESVKPYVPDLTPEDGFLLITAVGLTARSSLRKLFEGTDRLAALAFYPDPPGAAEIAGRLREIGGPPSVSHAAGEALAMLAAETDPGSFAQFLGTLALYAEGSPELSADQVAALAPETRPAELDALVDAVTGGAAQAIGPLLARLASAGTSPQGALSAVSRQMRRVLTLAADPGGPSAAVDRLRPPVRGPRRDRLIGDLRRWPQPRAEAALRQLHDTERQLRSSGPRPEAALAERCLLRLAMMAANRR